MCEHQGDVEADLAKAFVGNALSKDVGLIARVEEWCRVRQGALPPREGEPPTNAVPEACI